MAKQKTRKKEQGKSLYLALAIIVVIAVIFGIWLITELVSQPIEEQAPEYRLDIFEEGSIAPDNDFLQALSIQSRLKAQFQPDREGYGTFTVGEETATFDEIAVELPPIPDDMWKLIYVFSTGSGNVDACAISKEYYQQPEFITLPPFEQAGLRYWTNPDPTHWVESGEGGFPQMQTITIDKSTYAGDGPIQGTACAFLITAWGVQTYRGVFVEPYFLEKGVRVNPDQSTTTIMATGKDPDKYIDVVTDPNIVLLEPTFPLIKRGWIKKVSFDFTIDPETPEGTYILGAKASPIPDRAIDSQLQSLAFESGGLYSRPNTAFLVTIGDVANVPPIQFEIDVVE